VTSVEISVMTIGFLSAADAMMVQSICKVSLLDYICFPKHLLEGIDNCCSRCSDQTC
jgi:hypothetical protein